MAAVDLSLCLLINRAGAARPVRSFFIAISRLGDGVVWYIMILVWPLLYGAPGISASLHMGVVGLGPSTRR
ncbi:undecaprenyl-diphosphatase [Thiohalomonas denitrificans]|uniref:Undecaprenyl-diphosphatase n=2 Tax=Thiohalomonas denitrificans TaxID=415747 RepID=A0A1G5Q6I4_9GAMM|nr:undecaprenyl-diphosphatase [Thiohalomonas denitrificans]